MNTTLALEIVELALSLVQSKDANVADTLVKIIQKGAEAYQQHTGEALDPSLIKAEDPV
jgi:hypothetical protein